MKSKTLARNIYLSGESQKNFNFKKGFEVLVKADKEGKYICDAGIDWKEFDYKKGLDALIKADKNGDYIYNAGLDWKEFNYDKGLNALIDKFKDDGYYILLAGKYWKKFDYNKGLKALKNSGYYKGALKYWPKGIKQSLEISKDIRDKAKKNAWKKT